MRKRLRRIFLALADLCALTDASALAHVQAEPMPGPFRLHRPVLPQPTGPLRLEVNIRRDGCVVQSYTTSPFCALEMPRMRAGFEPIEDGPWELEGFTFHPRVRGDARRRRLEAPYLMKRAERLSRRLG